MKRRAFLALLLIASCSRPVPERAVANVAKTDPNSLPTDIVNERASLLDVTRGATIVSRTGELMLVASAIKTIDGEIATSWSPPPHDYPQSIVIALGATSRIDRVGFRSLTPLHYEANHVTFERSLDGATWQPLATMTTRHVSEAQWADVAPADAAYLRVTIPDAAYPDRDARINSLLARGTELAQPKNAAIDGCWSINGAAARFEQHGGRVTGVVEQEKQPLFLDGGFKGRIGRFNWIRGNDFGYTLLTVSPDGRHLSALNWHEEAIPLFIAFPWFGERSDCGSAATVEKTAAMLRRAGRLSMFGLQFDETGELLVEASRDELQLLSAIIRGAGVPIRIVAHEFRQPDATRNKQIAEREIASLRRAVERLGTGLGSFEYVAAGSDSPRHMPESDAARAIYSSVDVEVRR